MNLLRLSEPLRLVKIVVQRFCGYVETSYQIWVKCCWDVGNWVLYSTCAV